MSATTNIMSCVAMQCVIAALCCGAGTAQSAAADPTLLRSLATSGKIIAQSDVLADFAEGKEETKWSNHYLVLQAKSARPLT